MQLSTKVFIYTRLQYIPQQCKYYRVPTVILVNITNKKDKKRAPFSASSCLNKRAKGTASQPIPINSQAPAASLPLSPLSITNALQALVNASQALTYKQRFLELRPKDAITTLAKGSKHATAAALEASKDNNNKDLDEFEAYLIDKYNRINQSRLRKFQMPLSTYKFKNSQVYRYSY